MNRKYGIALALCALAWGGFWYLTRQVGPDPAGLAARALGASDVKDRASAATELCSLQDADATRQIRRLGAESQNAEVLVPALSGLAARADTQTMKLCIDRLDHEAKIVREVALHGLARMVGETPDNLDFKVDAPPETQRAAIERLRKLYDPDESTRAATIASLPLASAAPAPPEPPNTKKDPSKEAPCRCWCGCAVLSPSCC
jgi:hypothetical protein